VHYANPKPNVVRIYEPVKSKKESNKTKILNSSFILFTLLLSKVTSTITQGFPTP